MKIIFFSALAAVLVIGCGDNDKNIDAGIDAGTDTDTDADTDTNTDSDTDSDTNPAGNYWDDGYCGDYGNDIPASMDCNGVPGMVPGCCDADGKTLWCDSDLLWCIDCVAYDYICTWSVDDLYASWYECVEEETEPMEDPSGISPYYCDGTPLHEPDAGTDAGGDAG